MRFHSILKLFTSSFIVLIFIDCKPETTKNPLKEFTYKNVVVIVGDDHAYTTFGAYGNNRIKTPNLDRLAANGTRFTNAYANSPLCSASRQSILTGKYPHQTGVNLLFTPFNDATNTTVAEHCQSNGFATALIGKSHFNSFIWGALYKNDFPKFGFDTIIDRQQYQNWLKRQPELLIPDSIKTYSKTSIATDQLNVWNPNTLPQPYFDEQAEGTFLTKTALQFVEQNQEKRFLLWLAFHEPHAPFAFPVEYTGRYPSEDIELPDSSPEDDRWVPERFKNLTDEQKKGIIASYYTSVEYMDKNIGLLMDQLKKQGILEETLIVYLGDQGYLLYDHKRFEKHTMWKESIKAPLVFSGKTIPKEKQVDELIEFIDIVPTITDLLGLADLKEAEGNSFSKLFSNAEYEARDFVFAEFLEDNKAMVANKEWKYIFTSGKRDLGQGYQTGQKPSGILHRLYHLTEDPGETTNLADDPVYENMVDSLQRQMLERFMKTHPYANELPEFNAIEGKLAWFCEPRDVGAEYGGQPLPVFED